MAIKSRWLPFASFSLLAEFSSAVGQEYWHCDMKRGFKRARKKEPEVMALLSQDTTPQRIGLLGQRGIYEFHQNIQLLGSVKGVRQVAALLNLEQEKSAVQERVLQILKNYHQHPILRDKQILKLDRGDEGIPNPFEVRSRNFLFKLFAAIDCIFKEPDGRLHILDFKTGKSGFDLRQGYIYLLTAQYLFPKKKAIASFYNLETCEWSEPLTAESFHLEAIQNNLAKIARKHDLEKRRYRKDPTAFNRIFPPNPDARRCFNCQFHSICNFSAWEASA